MPVVVKFKVPLTLVSALRVKSAAVAVRFTSPPLLTALRVNASASVKLNAAAPVKAKVNAEKLLAIECTAELSRRVIEALVALNVRLLSVSKISLALMVSPAGCEIPVVGIITLPVPVVIKLKLPVTTGSADRVKSALVLVKLALPDVLAEVRVKALLSVKTKSPPPVKAKIKLLKLVI